MLALLFAPILAAILGIFYLWGADPCGEWMITGYIISAVILYFAMIMSE